MGMKTRTGQEGKTARPRLARAMNQKSQARETNQQVRLNKFIADSGVASRRKADEMIRTGQVQVNGKVVTELGVKIEPARDRVVVDGRTLRVAEQKLYLAFYKPEQVLTSMSDPLGRPTVQDYVEELPVRVYPVGRLDWDTEGLLILTNDGEFAQKVAHPQKSIPKTYLVKLNGIPTNDQLAKLLRGVTIPGGKASALHVERVPQGSKQYAWVKIVITEGRNRQVRKMFEKIGYDVKKLKRTAIGLFELGQLRKGQYVFLGPRGMEEVMSKDWVRPTRDQYRRRYNRRTEKSR